MRKKNRFKMIQDQTGRALLPQNPRKHKYAYLLIALSGCLTGCTSWNESFDCPVGEGMRCSSLSNVNTRMDRGEIDLSTEGPVSKSHFGSELLTTLGDV